MRIKVGFFTAKHPEIDSGQTSYVILWQKTFNATSDPVACFKAKQQVSLAELTSELHRRFPNATVAGYTFEVLRKSAGRTWLRNQMSVKLEDLARIQRGEFTVGEIAFMRQAGLN